jgi:ATPase subunit of ABC transporter with duplicated ATPase domains
MKLLTGRTAKSAEGRRQHRPKKLGVLRQDQFAFDAFRVIDTVIMGNARLWPRCRSATRSTRSPT